MVIRAGKGYVGAMFPWESGATGAEVCPSSAATGQLEQHITGDVAFAAQQYWWVQRHATATSGFQVASAVMDADIRCLQRVTAERWPILPRMLILMVVVPFFAAQVRHQE